MTKATAELNDLVAEAADGNQAAWWLLWERVEPRLERLLRNPRVTGRLSTDQDDMRNILVSVMEKLCDDDSRRLQEYVRTRDERSSFEAWLVVLTKRTAIDYMRGHPDYIDRRRKLTESGAAGEWVLPSELPRDSLLLGDRPPVTNRGSALSLLRYAYQALPPEQMQALELWILNHPYSVIAKKIGAASAHDASKLVRAALERLRRHFRGDGQGSS